MYGIPFLHLSVSLGCFCPQSFFMKDVLDKLPLTSSIYDLQHKLRITRRSVPGLATDTPCGVWDRGWNSRLLCGGPFLGICKHLNGSCMMMSSNGNIFRVTGHWRGALMFSLICVWINDWVNNREAGDLRRYRVHYDVIVMGMEVWYSRQACSIEFWLHSCLNTQSLYIIFLVSFHSYLH